MEYKVKITKTEYFEAEKLSDKIRDDYEGKAVVRVRAVVSTDIGRYHIVRWFVAEAPERMHVVRERHTDMKYGEFMDLFCHIKKKVRDREVSKAKETMKSVLEGIEPPYRTNTKTTKGYFEECRDAFETDKNGVVVGIKAA